MADVNPTTASVDAGAIMTAAAEAPKRSHHAKRAGPGRPSNAERAAEAAARAPTARKYKRAADVPVKFELPPSQGFDPGDVQALLDKANKGLAQICMAATVLVSSKLGRPMLPKPDDAAAFADALLRLGLLYLPDVTLTTGQLAMLSCAGLGVAMVAGATPLAPDPDPLPTAPPDETPAQV